jgi:amino acid adenylation domain-containing protein
MVGHYHTLLKAIVADPNETIATVPTLTQAERHQIFVEWNATAADYPKDCSIHQLFESQVERTPEAIAVQFEEKRLTYSELNSRANQLAHYLRGLGVGPEKLVGMCIDRSLEMVIGLLGILKAGGAYVPLEPSYPIDRLWSILDDTKASILLTEERLRSKAEWRGKPSLSAVDSQIKRIYLDTDWKTIARKSKQNPRTEVKPENLAYVLYTSGSTGMPKGVQIEHKSLVNLLCTVRSIVRFDETDAWTLFHSYAFDFSVWEIWGCLIHGGRLLIVPLELTHSPEAFWELLLKERITILNQTPSAIHQLIQIGSDPSRMAKESSLRLILVGGEVLPRELAFSLYQWGVPVWNFYGPTETTVWATSHHIKSIDLNYRSIPIGRPLPNIQIYILDSRLQPVPPGIPGEVYIGGAGLARGYLNSPDLTQDRFVYTSFHSGSSLYRTGDLARYLPDGTIEFLGRTDTQVKLRGYRIELGEIESILNQHPAVKDCVVVVRKREASTDKILVAYIVWRHHLASPVTELQGYLRRKLPPYMVPVNFVPLETLPLTVNKKVDRERLPLLDGFRTEPSQPLSEPRTAIEELLAQIWRDVLNLENLGTTDNFFELGGHSLLAIQIISRLCEVFSCDIPLRILFEAPTVAGLATKLEEFSRTGSSLKFPAIVTVARDRQLPLSFAQEQLWSLDQMLPGSHFFNVPFIYRVSGTLDVEALEKSLHAVIGRHEALRTVFIKIDGRPFQIIKQADNFRLSVTDFRDLIPGKVKERAATLILEEIRQCFDLTAGPLWSTKLVRLTNDEYFLLITMHHIICDQWSIQLFRNELSALYESFSKRRPLLLPEVSIQFADFASWERSVIHSECMTAQLAYWKEQLSEPLSPLEFWRKRNGKHAISFITSRTPIEIDETLSSGIKSLARRDNCTPFMVLIAALSLVLADSTGQSDIRIGTLMANRRLKETELTVGHFVNTVILRIRVLPRMSFGHLLRQVREVVLQAHAHQELPFERLAQVVTEQQNIDRAALFQILFMYQTLIGPPLRPAGLTLAAVPMYQFGTDLDTTVTSCDLIFDLRQTATKFTGALRYKTDIVSDKVTQMLNSFVKTLGCAIRGAN